eukprot:CAMPEP_0172667062 /NCGR_PEP_ID=MMETSP1074-20121228/8190_1 /TAXON_ID=2916 /ORGANISM="Ceratium fusus, Strain PA161109" /LENGTH=228 /DNA_ID=CAMNT_0013483525 /DNA_START=54 /DNA_END=740 /DNA_ORIENTATION=+
MELARIASPAVRRRGSRCSAVVIITALVAALRMGVTFTVMPATAAGESSRRSAAFLATGFFTAAPGVARAEEATKTAESTQQYTVAETFTVNFPSGWPIVQKNKQGFFVQPDKKESSEILSAAGKVVRYKTLQEGNGDVKDLSVRTADKMSGGEGKVVGYKAITVAGIEAYEIEVKNSILHEKWLVSLVPKGNDFFFCNVVVRTTPERWDQRKEAFDQILASFAPMRA